VNVFARMLRHLFPPSVARLFPTGSMQRIADAVAAGEATHRGQVCFAVEPALPLRAVFAGTAARQRALEAFAQLRVWDTVGNNGMLLYLLLADHRIEIVADRALAAHVTAEQWRGVCQLMEERLAAGDATDAAVQGVAAASALLARHFPRDGDAVDRNELPDLPHLL
jgi:uncharacterized membrane protein